MSSRRSRISLFFLVSVVVLASSRPADVSAVTRDEVMVRARSFAFHPWRMTSSNVRGQCAAPYRSVLAPGDYRGLPYDWGGYMSVTTFDQRIKEGYGAGSYPADGIIPCAVGLDCSGFVSQTWGASHTTTRGMEGISTVLASPNALLPGDVMNESGYHVSLYSHRHANGNPVWIESIDYGVHTNVTGGWSWVEGWKPLKYRSITGTTAQANPVGTTTNPILVDTARALTADGYSDVRNTAESVVDFFDNCGADRSKNEAGPEYVYKIVVTRPATLTATVSGDDADTDIDVHLNTSLNTNDCVARNNRTVSQRVDCGTYYIVADTFVNASGAQTGQYTLNVKLTDPGTTCGNTGPAAWNFSGEPGDRCSFPGNEGLPTCNPNLGSETCLYTTGSNATSWCTYSCATNADCGAVPGGCCQAIGNGEKYCMVSSFCGGTSTPDAGSPNTNTRDAGFGDADLDAGAPVVPDAGPPPPVDAGPPPTPDAGPLPPPVDAGSDVAVDAGAGSGEDDAGVAAGDDDAGSLEDGPDAGGGSETPTGCGCGAVDPGLALLVGALFIRRRRVVS